MLGNVSFNGKMAQPIKQQAKAAAQEFIHDTAPIGNAVKDAAPKVDSEAYKAMYFPFGTTTGAGTEVKKGIDGAAPEVFY